MAIRGLEHFKRDRDGLQLALMVLEQKTSPGAQLSATLVKAMLENYHRVIACAEEGKPFIANTYGDAPELFVAMDLPWYTLALMPYLPNREPYIMEEIDQSVKSGLGSDMCTLIRLSIANVESGHVPVPTAFVGLLAPCDGADMLHQAIVRSKDWCNVPIFCTDPPYLGGDREIDFHAREIRRMVAFLEEHTGRKLDVGRLREVIKESNNQFQLWAEYNELRRAVPCPQSAAMGEQAWNVAQNFMVGDPRGTEWFKKLVDITEQRVRAGEGSVPNERIRLFWFDIPPVWFPELTQWLKDEWKACIVMDRTAYAPYTLIDISNEGSMLRGLAKRNLCDIPMVRQARGTMDTMATDIVRVVKDYKINCVVWPAHMGHKDGSASVGIMKAICRDLGVSFLALGLDLFDKRYTSIDRLKDRFSEFFATMELG